MQRVTVTDQFQSLPNSRNDGYTPIVEYLLVYFLAYNSYK